MSLLYHREFKDGLVGKYAKVASKLSANSTVLEVGCNTGYFSRVMINHGHKVLGIEKDEETARIAKGQGVSVVCGDIEDSTILSSLGKVFDVVLLMDVLEHFKNPSVILKELKSVLSKDGCIMVTGPNVAYWAVRKDLLLGRWDYKKIGILDETHLHFYTQVGWRSLLEKSGYKVIALETAEGKIPFEHIFYEIPFFNSIISFFRNIAITFRPNLFTISYFIEAIPIREII